MVLLCGKPGGSMMKIRAVFVTGLLIVSIGFLSGCQENPPENRAPTADFTYSSEGRLVVFIDTSTDPDSDPLSYHWDFGDGGISTEKNPAHTYAINGTYVISLNVTDGTASNQKEETITLGGQGTPENHPPTAAFTSTINQTTRTVVFTDQSADEDNDVLSYFWDFGDEQNSTSQNPEHTYPGDNTYTVILTVSDGIETDARSELITINASQPPVPPEELKADFEFTQNNMTVFFIDTSTGDIVSWLWDFGDQQTSTENTTIHLYLAHETYTVILKVTDSEGNTDTKTKEVTVST
jgi:PKD repeat protein